LLSDLQRQNLLDESLNGMKIRLRVCSATTIPTQTAEMLPPPSYWDKPSPYVARQAATESLGQVRGDGGKIEIIFHPKQVNEDKLQTKEPNVSAGVRNSKTEGSSPRYLSYFDADGKKGNANMQWQVVAPNSPVVYEGRSDVETQARGIYREGGVYYSVQ